MIKLMDDELQQKLQALSDLQSRHLLWFVIGAFHLGEDERWPEVVEAYFTTRAREEAGLPIGFAQTERTGSTARNHWVRSRDRSAGHCWAGVPGGCMEPATFEVGWDQDRRIGKSVRVLHMTKCVCAQHAARFAAKYRIALPDNRAA